MHDGQCASVRTDWNCHSVGAFITTKPHLDRCVRYLRFGNGQRLTKEGLKITPYDPWLDREPESNDQDPREETTSVSTSSEHAFYDRSVAYFAVHCAFGVPIPAEVERFLVPDFALEHRRGLRIFSPACRGAQSAVELTLPSTAPAPIRNELPPVSFRFIELFAGVGMFRVACERAGGQCVFASEIAGPVRQVYKLNFGETPSGDITELPAHCIPDHDLLTAGFPCQSFSSAGDQKGLTDCRGQLFFEVCRILAHKQPRAFLLENVANLLTMEEGAVYDVVQTSLQQCGYSVSSRVIDAAAVVPQRRRRVYIVGFRHSGREPDESSSSAAAALWKSVEQLIASTSKTYPTVRSLLDETPSEGLRLTPNQWANVLRLRSHAADYAMDLDGNSPTLMGSYRVSYPKYSQFIPFPPQSSSVPSAQGHDDVVPWRFLSPQECARLQGFPPNFRMHPGTPDFAENAQYKLIGNAVCPIVVYAIVQCIVDCFAEREQKATFNADADENKSSFVTEVV